MAEDATFLMTFLIEMIDSIGYVCLIHFIWDWEMRREQSNFRGRFCFCFRVRVELASEEITLINVYCRCPIIRICCPDTGALWRDSFETGKYRN